MELQEALSQISEIRRQMARSEVFRGYRAVPVAGTGVLAILASVFQSSWIERPTESIIPYAMLWIGTAAIGMIWSGIEMVRRSRAIPCQIGKRATWLAVEQFLPSMIAGALVTVILVRSVPEVCWMLPGLWQIFFALGVFASFRQLPRATFGVAVFYLFTGLGCLQWARGEWALSPWTMGIPFGLGQAAAAVILYWNLERVEER